MSMTSLSGSLSFVCRLVGGARRGVRLLRGKLEMDGYDTIDGAVNTNIGSFHERMNTYGMEHLYPYYRGTDR